MRELVVGTRGSPLAVWQAEWVRAQMQNAEPGVSFSIRRIKTTGDKILDAPLATIGGKGLFVKEIDEALARREIDFAVHSMKDVPSVLPDGLEILGLPRREDPRDALISRNGLTLERLPKGARVGTSSLRRQAQLLHFRPDLRILTLRGNLGTRLRKLDEGEYDAIVLAAAGVKRLGLADRVTEFLDPEACLPAICQGALGIEGRADDPTARELAMRLDHLPTRVAVTAERAFLASLEGGCQVPMAAHATLTGDSLRLTGLVASMNGARLVRDTVQGIAGEAAQLGEALAQRLLEQGAREILQEIYEKA